MVNQYVWIGIVIGVFIAGIGIGYAVQSNTTAPMMMSQHQMQQMMNNPTQRQQVMNQMLSDPQTMTEWMNNMMSNPDLMTQMHEVMINDPEHLKIMNDPQHMKKMYEIMANNPEHMMAMMNDPQHVQQMNDLMMNNPQFMNQWMGTMMNNPTFQQQYMGPWMMMKDPQFMQQMNDQWYQGANLESSAVETNKVSILANTWQYQSTKAFSPSVIKISPGTTVTWTNEDVILHTVTDLGGSFDSGFIQADETWEYEFDSNNTYYYFCSIHPWMRGTVIVS